MPDSAMSDSTAAVLHGIEDIRLESRPVAAPGPGMVRACHQRCVVCLH